MTTIKLPETGDLVEIEGVTGNTAIQNQPGNGISVYKRLASGASRMLAYLLSNKDRTSSTGNYPNGGQPYQCDTDAYLYAQNIGINSDNNLRLGGEIGGPLDVGPVMTYYRDVPNPSPGSYLAGWYGAGKSGGPAPIDVVYGSIITKVIDNNPANPRGELVFCSAGPQPTNAGNYPRAAIGYGYHSIAKADLGPETSHVSIAAADVFVTIEAMRAGEDAPVWGEILGFDGGGKCTRQFDLAGSFGLVYHGLPVMMAVSGKCPCRLVADPGKYVNAVRGFGGTINTTWSDTAGPNTVGRVRMNHGSYTTVAVQ